MDSWINISNGGGGNGIGEGDGGCLCGGWRLKKGAETRIRGIGDDGKGGNENDNVAAEVMVRKVSTEEDGENKVEKGGAEFSGHANSPLMPPHKQQTAAIKGLIESMHGSISWPPLYVLCVDFSCFESI